MKELRQPGDWAYYVFKASKNRDTGESNQCTGGRGDYGNAIMGWVPGSSWEGFDGSGWVYDAQDDIHWEKRVAACVHVRNNYLACATHLAHRLETGAAFEQCKELMNEAVPYYRSKWGFSGPTVLTGDLNMRYEGTGSDVQKCVPRGYTRKGNGDVQHVIFLDHVSFEGSASEPMEYTDHHAWWVGLGTN